MKQTCFTCRHCGNIIAVIHDAGVPVQNSLNLAAALADHGVLFELHVYPEGRHGLGLAAENPPVSQWAADCCRWLLEKGYGR